MNAYQEKLNKLPANVRDFLNSVAGTDLNLFICKQNGLVGDDIILNTDLVADLFFKDLELKDLVTRIKDDFDFDDVKARKLAADIAGIRLLVIDNWFNGGVSAYLKSLGVSPADYQKIVDDQKIAVRKEKEEDAIEEAERQAEKAEREAALNEEAPIKKEEPITIEGDFKINWEVEKEEVLKTFKNGLADIISSGAVQEEFNDVLIYLLADKGESFRAELERALLANNEVITFAKFAVGGRPAAAVISAWLKNFISEVGSGLFDNLTLTKFLTSSANCKVLSDEEKNIVKKLLLVYRNIKFFPASMPNKTGEGWEIIPSETEIDLTKAKTVGVPLTADYAAKAESARMAAVKEEQNRKEAARAEEISRKLTELQAMAAAYPAGSLQRKAVEEEIRKLSKK
jgi:hypothetical protein